MKRGQEVNLREKYNQLTDKDLALFHSYKHELEQKYKDYDERFPDNSYEEFSSTRAKELATQVSDKRRTVPDAALKNLRIDEIYNAFKPLYNKFNEEFPRKEASRKKTYKLRKESTVMSEYLLNIDRDVIAEARKLEANEQVNKLVSPDEKDADTCHKCYFNTDKDPVHPEPDYITAARDRLRRIKEWSKFADNFTKEDLDRAHEQHLERLKRYRNRKPWEAWIEEDELDLEGERLLSEIKNYKEEHFFNTKFYR